MKTYMISMDGGEVTQVYCDEHQAATYDAAGYDIEEVKVYDLKSGVVPMWMNTDDDDGQDG